MQKVEIQDLRQRIDELLRIVQEEGETVEFMDHGEAVARLIPARKSRQSTEKTDADAWAELRNVAKELAPYWPQDTDAVEIVREGRREL